jgi:predicted ATPase
VIVEALSCPTFVGRSEELGALLAARRGLAQSRGAVVLVGGEAGIGKSRLLSQFLASVGRDRRPRHLAIAECIEHCERPCRLPRSRHRAERPSKRVRKDLVRGNAPKKTSS